jgi:hypothetical protein
MATLTNPIRPQNIVDRYEDFVTATANSGIVWGTNAPGPSYTDANGTTYNDTPSSLFGGSTSGVSISIGGQSIANAGDTISASDVVNTLISESQLYTNIRNLRVTISISGGGGNSGSRRSSGTVIDQTRVAHMSTSYRQTLDQNFVNTHGGNSNVAAGQTITTANLEGFFTNLRSAYTGRRGNTHHYSASVCHNSCHSNCHSARGRR